jgi:hypothetical protein
MQDLFRSRRDRYGCGNLCETGSVIFGILMCAHTIDCPGAWKDARGHRVTLGRTHLPVENHDVLGTVVSLSGQSPEEEEGYSEDQDEAQYLLPLCGPNPMLRFILFTQAFHTSASI